MNIFAAMAMQDPFYFFSWVLIVTFSICVHEYAHAITAWKEGDDTAALLGHLTLNPLVQMGWSSLVMLLLFGIAWGAVPVNVSRMRSYTSAALVAFAGPAANLLLCLLSGFALVVSNHLGASDQIQQFLDLAASANGVLFLFNMLPIPMFDGWAVASLFIPAMKRLNPAMASQVSWFALLAVWMTPVGSLIWSLGMGISGFFINRWMDLAGLFS